MFILDNVPLPAYSSMKLGGIAAHMVEISDRFEVREAIHWARERELSVIVLGHGTNVIWKDEGFAGLVIVNKIKKIEFYAQDENTTYVTAGAGEVWDDVVKHTVDKGLSGIETLSLIPGTAGATPVQNVGAYGSEISSVLTTVEAFDIQQDRLVTLRGDECNFSYRSSKFKTTDRGRFVITAITMRLTKSSMRPPFYGSLQRYLTERNIYDYSPASIRKAVIAIRQAKLPDPAIHPNNGSFFQNPIVSRAKIQRLIDFYPELMYWEIDNERVKVSAAWLLEQTGFKGFYDQETGMRTWNEQPLVFVNESAKSTTDLLQFKAKVTNVVKQKFGIELQQEPELLP